MLQSTLNVKRKNKQTNKTKQKTKKFTWAYCLVGLTIVYIKRPFGFL